MDSLVCDSIRAGSEPFVSDEEVAAVFRLLAHAPPLPDGVRVTLDGRVRKEYEDLVLASPPRKGETWQKWTARLFGDRPFSIVANGVERFPTEIPRRVARAVRSWIDTSGLPLGGIDVSLVIGNKARGLSASLALSPRDQAPGELARAALGQLLENSFMGTPEAELPFSRVMGRVPNLQRLLRASGLSSASRRPCREWLEQGIEDYRRALLSNGGLTLAPVVEEVDAQGLDGRTIRAVAPFPMLWRRERSNIVLFVRRTVRTLAMHPALPGLIERLNRGERLAVGEVVERLEALWEKRETLHMLKLLADAGGIEVMRGKRRAR